MTWRKKSIFCNFFLTISPYTAQTRPSHFEYMLSSIQISFWISYVFGSFKKVSKLYVWLVTFAHFCPIAFADIDDNCAADDYDTSFDAEYVRIYSDVWSVSRDRGSCVRWTRKTFYYGDAHSEKYTFTKLVLRKRIMVVRMRSIRHSTRNMCVYIQMFDQFREIAEAACAGHEKPSTMETLIVKNILLRNWCYGSG